MWLSDLLKALLLLAVSFGLVACGFTPAYAPGGAGERLRGEVLVAAPQDREDFTFVARIEDRLGRNTAAEFSLSYKITISQEELAIRSDQQIQRYNLVGAVDFTVTKTETGAVLTSGKVSSFSGYSATGTTVATRAAERDAYTRLTSILADQVITRLVATGPSWQP